MAQQQKLLLLMQDMWAQSLGQEDPLEKQMATHSSILAWEIPWIEEPGGLQAMSSHRVGHFMTKLGFSFSYAKTTKVALGRYTVSSKNYNK